MSERQLALEQQPLLQPEDIERTPVYPVIQLIRYDVTHFIDTALSHEVLMGTESLYTIVRPLEDKYIEIQRRGNLSVVFCFLVTRIHFLRDDNLATNPISRSRAELCEILATCVFRDYGNDMLQLTLALTTSWPVYNGADPEMLEKYQEEHDEELEDRVGNAIEIAILGKAKRFIRSSPCQRVIDCIWSGKYVYQAQSSHSIVSDTYKRMPVHMYDPHRAPLLDHYRLKVPFIRSALEYINFLILFILFIVAIEVNDNDYINLPEAVFMIYALGFTLEKVATMQEHGMRVYFNGTWNGFDLAFITTYLTYGFFRIYGVYYDHNWARELGIDFLAIIACLMFPRLAFVTLQNNLMVLSLRAMMVQFTILMCIAGFCFCGFLYALWTLSRSGAGYGPGTIAWWMLDLFFGLDASGFDRATQFHPFFGPILMVTYACLSNTLLVTVLVSILSNTFATINEDAAAEVMFRRAVSTIEGVKADVLFSYQPPVNLVALCIMLPASYTLSPRWFHKVNVFMIRLTSFPVLLLIAAYERQSKNNGTIGLYDTIGAVAEKMFDTFPRGFKRMTFFEGLAGSDADIDAIFRIEEEFASALHTSPGDDRDPDERLHPRRGHSPSARPHPAAGHTPSSSPHALAPGHPNGQLPSPLSGGNVPASPRQIRVPRSSSPPRPTVSSSQPGTPTSLTQVLSASPPQMTPPAAQAPINAATTTSEPPSTAPATIGMATGVTHGPVSLQPLRQRTSSTRLGVRPRINSMVPRTTADLMSPLAMLYQQPLLVDDGIVEENLLSLSSPTTGPGSGAPTHHGGPAEGTDGDTGGARLTPPDETQELFQPGPPASPAVLNFNFPARRRLSSMQSLYRGVGVAGGLGVTGGALPLHHPQYHHGHSHLAPGHLIQSSPHPPSSSSFPPSAVALQRQPSQSSAHSASGLRNVVFPGDRDVVGSPSGDTALNEVESGQAGGQQQEQQQDAGVDDEEATEEEEKAEEVVLVDVQMFDSGVDAAAEVEGETVAASRALGGSGFGRRLGSGNTRPEVGPEQQDRLAGIERRQERIESLLVQLMNDLRKGVDV